MHEDIQRKLTALHSLYRLHDRLTGIRDLACAQGCSVCCTRNVTLTSLEAVYLLDGLDADARHTALARIAHQAHRQRLIPKITINAMADVCSKGLDLPDEDSDPAWGPCPLLEHGLCTVYAIRPFACRSMVSCKPCGDSGIADMDEFLVTVNNVFMQYLEHVDREGITANLSDLLPALCSEQILAGYRNTGFVNLGGQGFLKNQPLSVLMVPPEHRDEIRPILNELQRI